MTMSDSECRALEHALAEQRRRGSDVGPRAGGLIPTVHWHDVESLRKKIEALEARIKALEEKG